MSDYKVVQMQDQSFYKIEGFSNPILRGDAVVTCDIDPAVDTPDEQANKMLLTLNEFRRGNSKIVDGDGFDTPYGKMVVRGNLVMLDDANGTIKQAAAASTTQATAATMLTGVANPTLGQVISAMGMSVPPNWSQTLVNTPINQIPWGTISAPPSMKHMFAPPLNANTGVNPSTGMNINPQPAGLPPTAVQQSAAQQQVPQSPFKAAAQPAYVATDSNGNSIHGRFSTNGLSNQAMIDEFNAHINHVYGDGDIVCAIRIPGTQSRVIEVLYQINGERIVIVVN